MSGSGYSNICTHTFIMAGACYVHIHLEGEWNSVLQIVRACLRVYFVCACLESACLLSG